MKTFGLSYFSQIVFLFAQISFIMKKGYYFKLQYYSCTADTAIPFHCWQQLKVNQVIEHTRGMIKLLIPYQTRSFLFN